jgi:predicted ATPase/Tfp pilus assembly protein PilF
LGRAGHSVGLGPLVGRAADLQRIEALLREHRLTTIWGPPGIGKTRLALEVAERAPDAVWVSLSDCGSSIGFVTAVTAALGGPVEPAPSEQAIGERAKSLLAAEPRLLILDNLEQVAAAAAETIAGFLTAAPELRVLVTSRERLRLRAEAGHELGPLRLEANDDAPSHALELFVERLRRTAPSTALSDDDTARARQIVASLEGVPLSIELAAAQVEILGIGGVLERLSDHLSVLRGRVRDVDARQRSLRATLDWSWELLSDTERRALAEASVFAGGFFLDAAEAVLTGKGTQDAIEALRDRSMLRRHEVGGRARFSLFESVRQYAAARGGDPGVLDRHAAYFATEAGRLRGDLEAGGDRAAAARARIGTEAANLRAAAAHLQRGTPLDATTAAQLVETTLALDPMSSAAGAGDYLALLEAAMESAAVAKLPAGLRARARLSRGRILNLRGERERAVTDLETAHDIADSAGDTTAQCAALAELGLVHHQVRDLEAAERCYEEVIATARSNGDRRAEARALGNLGAVHHDSRRFERARERYRMAIEMLRQLGESRLEGIFQNNLGLLSHEAGEYADAKEQFGRALRLLLDVGDLRYEAITLGNVGMLHHELRELDAARAAHEASAAGLARTPDVHSRALAQARLGAVLAELGRLDEAERAFDAAETLAARIDEPITKTTLEVLRAFVDLALARQRVADERPATAAAARARRRMELAHDGASGRSAAEVSDDVRTALRILGRGLRELPAKGGATHGGPQLRIGPGAGAYRPPGGQWHDLSRHHAMRRILLRLIEQHAVASGRGVSVAALQCAAWPGERMQTSAGANRVYVAIANLRKRGLQPYLQRGDEGYFLDPEVEVVHGEELDE